MLLIIFLVTIIIFIIIFIIAGYFKECLIDLLVTFIS